MTFRIGATTKDGEAVWTTRLMPATALVVAERWQDQGLINVSIVERSGASSDPAQFRARQRASRARLRALASD